MNLRKIMSIPTLIPSLNKIEFKLKAIKIYRSTAQCKILHQLTSTLLVMHLDIMMYNIKTSPPMRKKGQEEEVLTFKEDKNLNNKHN